MMEGPALVRLWWLLVLWPLLTPSVAADYRNKVELYPVIDQNLTTIMESDEVMDFEVDFHPAKIKNYNPLHLGICFDSYCFAEVRSKYKGNQVPEILNIECKNRETRPGNIRRGNTLPLPPPSVKVKVESGGVKIVETTAGQDNINNNNTLNCNFTSPSYRPNHLYLHLRCSYTDIQQCGSITVSWKAPSKEREKTGGEEKEKAGGEEIEKTGGEEKEKTGGEERKNTASENKECKSSENGPWYENWKVMAAVAGVSWVAVAVAACCAVGHYRRRSLTPAGRGDMETKGGNTAHQTHQLQTMGETIAHQTGQSETRDQQGYENNDQGLKRVSWHDSTNSLYASFGPGT